MAKVIYGFLKEAEFEELFRKEDGELPESNRRIEIYGIPCLVHSVHLCVSPTDEYWQVALDFRSKDPEDMKKAINENKRLKE